MSNGRKTVMSRTKNEFATAKLYRYGCFYTFGQIIFGWFLFAVCVLMFFGIPVVFAVALLRTGRIDMPTVDLLGFAFVWILLPPVALNMLMYINFFSPILVSDEYLTVRFCFRRFKIPWEHIQELKRLGLLRTRGVLIRVSKSSLPWIYALYGVTFWQLGGRYIPVFSRIEDYQDLIKEIKKRSGVEWKTGARKK
jgi:hypothetical protein